MSAPGLRFDGGEHTFFSALGEPLPNFIIAKEEVQSSLEKEGWCAAKSNYNFPNITYLELNNCVCLVLGKTSVVVRFLTNNLQYFAYPTGKPTCTRGGASGDKGAIGTTS